MRLWNVEIHICMMYALPIYYKQQHSSDTPVQNLVNPNLHSSQKRRPTSAIGSVWKHVLFYPNCARMYFLKTRRPCIFLLPLNVRCRKWFFNCAHFNSISCQNVTCLFPFFFTHSVIGLWWEQSSMRYAVSHIVADLIVF